MEIRQFVNKIFLADVGDQQAQELAEFKAKNEQAQAEKTAAETAQAGEEATKKASGE